MILISHRGNINGPIPKLENNPFYISQAMDKGYSVEIDVWYDKGWWLGHDEPKYKITRQYLDKWEFWIHCKNLDALSRIGDASSPKYFWHQNDEYTLTSQGLIWTFPRKILTKKSICVLPEMGSYTTKELKKCYGICSDVIEKYKNI